MELWLIIVIVIIVLLVIYIVSTYNKLISLRNMVDDQWSQIDIQLKRRFDLIPNVVETVKGYAKHEKETLENVIKARNSFTTSQSKEDEINANNELTNAISKLFALAENYPDLKANQNFIDLQNQLKETEDKISYARQFYNDTALKYNNKIMMIPSNIIAGLFGFKKAPFFLASDKEKENVKVSF